MLGWDITDYGLNNFDKIGFSLITIRNGNRNMNDEYPKVYLDMKDGIVCEIIFKRRPKCT